MQTDKDVPSDATETEAVPDAPPSSTLEPYLRTRHVRKHFRTKNAAVSVEVDPATHPFRSRVIPAANVHPPRALDMLATTVRMNWVYFVALVACCLAFGDSLWHSAALLAAFFGAGIVGYFIHMFSHSFSFHDNYNATPNVFREIGWLQKPIRAAIWFFDYHHIYHHDSDVNKKPLYVAAEFVNNLWMEGLEIVAFLLLAKFIPLESILVWAFVYATVHHINYVLKPCIQHIRHHRRPRTNYGYDIYDILFGSKYDMGSFENYNDTAINLVVGFALVFYARKLIRGSAVWEFFKRQ
jgi:hypothetical protein